MKIDAICRVCLKEGNLKPIFETHKTEESGIIKCTDMLVLCAAVTVEKLDGFPSRICNHCFKKLWSAYKFRRLCEKSFLYLKNYIYENKPLIQIKVERQDENFDTDLNELKDCSGDVNDLVDNKDLELSDKVKCEDEDADYEDNLIYEAKVEDFDSDYVKNEVREKLKIKKIKAKKLKSIHNEKSIKKSRESNDGLFKCLHCPKLFKYRFRLLAHEDTHIGIKRYFCEICQKAYRSEKDHTRMHQRGFNYKCDICSKCFNTKAKLTIHMGTHNTNREKFICGIDGCTKAFVTLGGMQKHQSQHDGVKNFVCHLCSKRFLDKYALDMHLRIHNNERNYQCSYCPKKFIQSSAKSSHEKRHTNTRNHQCPSCEKKFYTPASLRRHYLSHTKILNEVCRFCSKRFARRDNRRRHEVVIHGVTEVEEKKELSP